MAVQVVIFGGTSAAKLQTVTLSGVEYRLRVRWSEPLAAWYMDLYTATGDPIQVGRRLSPGYAPLLGLNGADGLFLVDGQDGAPMQALADGDMLLLYVE